MQRVLDIDLDFFVTPVVHWPSDTDRPDASEYSVWPTAEALRFLREQCGLDRKLPGFVTENHGELFPLWRGVVESRALTPPFHVTHVDAHADLGLGDAGYSYLMTSLLYEPVGERVHPTVDSMSGLNDGNFLLFAIACHWIGELHYVFGAGGGSDELVLAMEGFNPKAERIQLSAMSKSQLNSLLHHHDRTLIPSEEPTVPYRSLRWEQFQTDGPYDFVCLTRSPPYTPATADVLYDAIRGAFIDPITEE